MTSGTMTGRVNDKNPKNTTHDGCVMDPKSHVNLTLNLIGASHTCPANLPGQEATAPSSLRGEGKWTLDCRSDATVNFAQPIGAQSVKKRFKLRFKSDLWFGTKTEKTPLRGKNIKKLCGVWLRQSVTTLRHRRNRRGSLLKTRFQDDLFRFLPC